MGTRSCTIGSGIGQYKLHHERPPGKLTQCRVCLPRVATLTVICGCVWWTEGRRPKPCLVFQSCCVYLFPNRKLPLKQCLLSAMSTVLRYQTEDKAMSSADLVTTYSSVQPSIVCKAFCKLLLQKLVDGLTALACQAGQQQQQPQVQPHVHPWLCTTQPSLCV